MAMHISRAPGARPIFLLRPQRPFPHSIGYADPDQKMIAWRLPSNVCERFEVSKRDGPRGTNRFFAINVADAVDIG